MSDERDRETLQDIRDAADHIVRFIAGTDESAFYADVEKQSAVMYQALIIGEAAKRLSPAAHAAFPDVPWRQMARLRDILVHHYGKVDLQIVWQIASVDVPALIAALQPQQSMRSPPDDAGVK